MISCLRSAHLFAIGPQSSRQPNWDLDTNSTGAKRGSFWFGGRAVRQSSVGWSESVVWLLMGLVDRI